MIELPESYAELTIVNGGYLVCLRSWCVPTDQDGNVAGDGFFREEKHITTCLEVAMTLMRKHILWLHQCAAALAEEDMEGDVPVEPSVPPEIVKRRRRRDEPDQPAIT